MMLQCAVVVEVVQSLVERGYSILLVEQNATRALAVAHYAYILDTGSVALEGPGNDLLHDDAVRRAYLAM